MATERSKCVICWCPFIPYEDDRGICPACNANQESSHRVGPVETLARLSLQSKRYTDDYDFRVAVDAVLGVPQYDAAPKLLAALTDLVWEPIGATTQEARERKLRRKAALDAIAAAEGRDVS